MKSHDGPHDGSHPDCFGCRVKHVNVAPSAMPSRHNKVAPRPTEPRWERGVAGERRPDGSFMPYLEPNLSTVGIKAYAEKKKRIDKEVTAIRQGHVVPT